MTTELPPDASEVHTRLSAAMAAGRWEDALALLECEPELVAADPGIAWSRGWALYKLKRLAEAAYQLQVACRLDSENPIRPWALGVVQSEMKDYAHAERNLLRALQLKDSGLARLSLAVVYMKQGRLTDAENIHLEGLRLRPNDRERIEAFADFLTDLDRSDEADALYARAAQLPSRAERRSLNRLDE
jgi:tetratricopeptide (TPR) repeat protein